MNGQWGAISGDGREDWRKIRKQYMKIGNQ